MFDSGFLEMLVIGLIALLVVGPERLPGVAAKAGKLIGKLKAFVATTRADIERELRAEELQSMLDKQKEEINELRDMMKNTQQEVDRSLNETSQSFNDQIIDVKKSLNK